MFLIKKDAIDTWVYRGKDENDNYIIEDWMCNEYEMSYANSTGDLLHWVNVTMDVDTEIEVIPAKEVLDCPLKDWYFYY